MVELWLIRHAESLGNVRGDQADTGLSAVGEAQAKALERRLRELRFDAVFSSDLKRCTETARLALPGTGVVEDARLREFDTGPETRFVDPASLTREELLALARTQGHPFESGAAFVARVQAWLSELPASGRVIVFTHTQVIRELLTLLCPERGRSRDGRSNAGVTRLELHEGGARVVAVDEPTLR